MEIKKYIGKKTALGLVGALTVMGTISGTSGGLTPLYTKKTGTSYGINLGLLTEFKPGSKFYGLSISFLSTKSGGVINGIDLSIGSPYTNGGEEERISKTNGIEASILSLPSSLEDAAPEINGLQFSFMGEAGKESDVVQVGGYLQIERENDKRRSVFVNYSFQDDE